MILAKFRQTERLGFFGDKKLTWNLHLLLSEKCLLNEPTSLKVTAISQAAVILTISVIVIAIIIILLIVFLFFTIRKNNQSPLSLLPWSSTVKYEPVQSDDDYLS